MEFCALSSGSCGNSHYIESNHRKILIDAGLSGKKIEGLLRSVDKKPEELDALFVTHEHTDHVKGIGILSRRYDIPIYANEKTWQAMEDGLGKIDEKNKKIFKTDQAFQLDDLYIKPIGIYHDAAEPVGYVIMNGDNKKISIVTDTGKLDARIMSNIKDSSLYLLESNHDVQMLRNGSYPYYLKERVLSDFGHLSNKYASEAIKSLVRGKEEIVLLGHLSKDNNTPKMAFNETAFTLMELGLDIKKDVRLELTSRQKATEIFEI